MSILDKLQQFEMVDKKTSQLKQFQKVKAPKSSKRMSYESLYRDFHVTHAHQQKMKAQKGNR